MLGGYKIFYNHQSAIDGCILNGSKGTDSCLVIKPNMLRTVSGG